MSPGIQNNDTPPTWQDAGRGCWARILTAGWVVIMDLAPLGYEGETGFHLGTTRSADRGSQTINFAVRHGKA